MESKLKTLAIYQDSAKEYGQPSSLMPLSEVQHEHQYELNDFNLFVAHFNTIPNRIFEHGISIAKAYKWLLENCKTDIKDVHYTKRYIHTFNRNDLHTVHLFLYDDLMICIQFDMDGLQFYFRNTDVEIVEELILKLKQFKAIKQRKCHRILLLRESGHDSYIAQAFKLARVKIDLKRSYNDDLLMVHNSLLKSLSKTGNSGVVLLYGIRGTGKTNYSRYLVSLVKKDVLFLSSAMVAQIDPIKLLGLIINHPNTILVIDDAESLLRDGDFEINSPLSTILNLTDDFVADILNLQIICIFNEDISNLDNTLLQMGRLIASYHFQPLDTN